ncbi:HD-GYP domain-containing protein [Kiloniella antarctica]|uniref:HD-GYP domain-containing protein n=1 Tax=Kiloniella antarctica TaxID=1550907 RepID=A0ABW5BIP3_9PROT
MGSLKPNFLNTETVHLSELVSAISTALDMTEGQPIGHCVRSCWIGIHIGQEIGMSEEDLSELYYMILLKDLGCSSNAARICQLYLTDDQKFKHDFKRINGSLPQALRFVLSHTGLQASLSERFQAIIKILQDGGEIARELIETRCHRGAEIALKMRFSEKVADGILNLDERWDGKGLPSAVSGNNIPVFARIALLSQVIDVFLTSEGQDAALGEVRSRSGSWFEPEMVSAFERVALRPEFWEELNNEDLQNSIHNLVLPKHDVTVDEDYLDNIAAAFAKVIDAKSPFTNGHSERVMGYSDLIAQKMGLSESKRRWLKRAALLHDIGKLGISNSILDKPGKLTDEEFAMIKMHPVYSVNILKNISAFSDISPIAGGHHERLDGKGYPYGLTDNEIDMDIRIVTVADIFDALTADRPYRAAMPMEKAISIMDDMVDTAIDSQCYKALKDVLQEISTINSSLQDTLTQIMQKETI